MFVVSRPKVFTADSASGLRLEVYGLRFTASGLPLQVYRFRFTASGLRAESDTPFANPFLRADRSTATLRFARNKGGRMIRRRMFIESLHDATLD